MRLIHVFDRKWFRRLLMILLGLGLGFAYFIDRDLSPWGPFIATGYLIGFLSDRLLTCIVNLLIVLFAMIGVVLVFYISGFLGGNVPIEAEGLSIITSLLFITKATLSWLMIPGIAAGQIVRYFVLRRSDS